MDELEQRRSSVLAQGSEQAGPASSRLCNLAKFPRQRRARVGAAVVAVAVAAVAVGIAVAVPRQNGHQEPASAPPTSSTAPRRGCASRAASR